MKHYQVAYDKTTGHIRFVSLCSGALSLPPGENLTVLLSEDPVDPSNSYVADGAIKRRQALPRFDKTSLKEGEEATLSGLPNPCTVIANGIEHTVTDGEFILPWNGTGQFVVRTTCFPYFDSVEVINCV